VFKKVFILIVSIVSLTYLFFFSGFFSLNLNPIQSESLFFATKIYLFSALTCFLIGEITKNYSQIDKIWSIIPIVYVWYFTIQSDFDSRMLLMSTLVSIWGVRLTLNFARRGGYSIYFWRGEEDYRWKILRKKTPWLKRQLNWSLFNLFFICFYQMGLIFLFTLPILAAWTGGNEISFFDYLIGFLMLLFIILETISDQQQYNFQTSKYQKIKLESELIGDYKRGFLTSGLWSYSRHPNFTCEQIIWIIFYLFSISATGEILNWSIAGCILLVILFYNSAKFSEEISAAKYPKYKEYQMNVPMFFGRFKSNWKD